MGRKRVLLADDQVEMVEQARRLLESDYDVVAAVHDGAALLEAAQQYNPDVIISDISMPRMTGFEAFSRIRALGIPSKLIFLTIQSSPAYLKKARALGEDGYVLKVNAHEDLLPALTAVIRGSTYFPQNPPSLI